QNVLHDVLGLVDGLTGTRKAPSRGRTQDRRDRFQQPMICRAISGHGRPHQAGPLVFTLAHARSQVSIRSIYQFVTCQTSNHEVVIRTPAKSPEQTPGSCSSPLLRAHSIERRSSHGGVDFKTNLRVPLHSVFKIESTIAKVSPSVGQRFPFSAPLLSRRGVSVVR